MQKIYDISETTKPDHQRTICVLISTRLPFGFLNCDEVEYMNPAGGGDISLSNIPYATCQEPSARCQENPSSNAKLDDVGAINCVSEVACSLVS